MQDTICPIDGKPCDKNCHNLYTDTPSGGCFVTTALEMGISVFVIDETKGAPNGKLLSPVRR